MNSALEFLFESELTDRIFKFIRSRGERARIIAPSWVRERVMAHKLPDDPPSLASWSETPGIPAPKTDGIWNYVVVCDNAKEERAMIEELAKHRGIKIYGLFGTVLPALLCGANAFSRAGSLGDVKRYAVLCVPRSGSRYLASVLNRSGLGLPQEHLREPLAVAITDGKLGFQRAFTELERFGQRNGIFGTKLISTFLIRACNGNLAAMEKNIGWMSDRGYKFIFLDRPLNESVISNYIASRLKKWHFFEQMDDTTKDVLDNMEFDREAAWNEYVRFRAQKLTLAHLASKFSIPGFEYETVQNSVERIVSSICECLDVDPSGLAAGSASIPVPTRSESHTYDQLSRSLDGLLSDKGDEIVPATIKMLGKLVRADKATAESIAASFAA